MYEMSDKKLKELEEEFKEKEIKEIPFEELSFKDKVSHILEYYKYHMIVGIAALIAVISIGSAVVKNLNTIIVLDVTFLTSNFEYTEAEGLESYWYDLLYDEEEKKTQQVVLDFVDIRDDVSPDVKMATQSKFMAKSTTQDFDLFIMEESFFEDNNKAGLLQNMEELIDVEALGISSERLYYVDDQLLGIEVTDIPFLDKVIQGDQTLYIGIFYASHHIDNVVTVIEDMLME